MKTLAQYIVEANASLPTAKDFERDGKYLTLYWECQELTSSYEKMMEFPKCTHWDVTYSGEKFGLYFRVLNGEFSMGTYKSGDGYTDLKKFPGIGGIVSGKASDTKKAILDIVKKINDNPKFLEKLIEIGNISHKSRFNGAGKDTSIFDIVKKY